MTKTKEVDDHDVLIGQPQLMVMFSIRTNTIANWQRLYNFPKPSHVINNKKMWRLKDVREWRDKQSSKPD